MFARYLLALVLGFSLLSSSGCCWMRRVLCDECCSPCDTGAFTYYAGCSCGPRYWGDWISHPPKCDPCDSCGNYIGDCQCGPPRRFLRPGPAPMTVGGDCDCAP